MSKQIRNLQKLKFINDSKFIGQINGKKYIIWQAKPHQIPLLSKLGNCKLLEEMWVAQEWLENSIAADINDISHNLLFKIHMPIPQTIDDSWLQPIDEMWGLLSGAQKQCLPLSWTEYKTKLKAVTPNNGVIIHGDIHPGNIVLYRGEICLVDWEWCAVGPAEYDLAKLKQHMNNKEHSQLIAQYAMHRSIDYNLIEIYYNLCFFLCACWALTKTTTVCPQNSLYKIQEYREFLKIGKQDINYADLAASAIAEFKVF